MSMFKKYEDNSYTAYNITPPVILNTASRYIQSPIILFDKFHNIKAFVWDPEDEFSLNIGVGLKLPVLENSIIYEASGLHPTSSTQGIKGQRAYNIVDLRSWICKGLLSDIIQSGDWIPLSDSETNPEWIPLLLRNSSVLSDDTEDVIDNEYVWEEDKLLTFVVGGKKELLFTPDMNNKTLNITIMNFRHEVIYDYEVDNKNTISIKINNEDTPLLVEGQFLLNVYIKDSTGTHQLVQYDITILENPSKYVCPKNLNDNYIVGNTIQTLINNQYIWEPLNNLDNDYIWIPIEDTRM